QIATVSFTPLALTKSSGSGSQLIADASGKCIQSQAKIFSTLIMICFDSPRLRIEKTHQSLIDDRLPQQLSSWQLTDTQCECMRLFTAVFDHTCYSLSP